MPRLPLFLAAALLAAGPAAAQDRPLLAPTHDATIDYQLDNTSGNGPRTMRMYVTAGGQHMRVEPQGGRAIIIIDHAAQKSTVLMTERHVYMVRPIQPGQRQGPIETLEHSKLARTGTRTIAGHACTVWEVQDEHKSTICVTADGLVLQGISRGDNGDSHTTMTATAVNIAPVDPTLFQPPADYTEFQMPQIPGMPGGMPGRGLPPGVVIPKP